MQRSYPAVFLVALALTASALPAVEGKWTPEQLAELDPAWLAELGLELPVEELWDPAEGGLLQAIVRVGGCSAGFVSPQGLLITNHHCAYSILQQHSTPERNLIRDGFLAATPGDELPAASVRATVPIRFEDVTARVETAAAVAGDDDLARYRAIERARKELVAECEKRPFRRCRAAVYDGGRAYRLIEALELPDVRLVWAPPAGVGEFGGEVDNWSWPRHTGDFALLRAYALDGREPAPYSADNLPFRPSRHLSLATEGVGDGDFVLVAGYPGTTRRSLIADEVAIYHRLYYPGRSALYRSWLGLMEAAGEGDEAARIALAGRIKTLANREKNARGQVAGIRRGDLVEGKRRNEREVLAWATAYSAHRRAVDAYRGLERLAAAERETWERDFLLDQMDDGPLPLAMALSLVRWARESEKLDLERRRGYQERDRERAGERLRRDQKRLHPPTEKHLLADLLSRFAALPAGQRSPAIDRLLGADPDAATVAARAAELVDATRVTELETRMAMFGEAEPALAARRDPLLELAFALDDELEAARRAEERRGGAASRLRPVWLGAVAARAGRPVAPDANGTLRLSLARVEGYRPRDAVWLEPRTRLAGVVEKHTGEEPFDAPDAVLAAALAARETRWADPELGDVPVGFLADGDTTGGSSGSPVLNGRGELVGVNFDRVWENVANDFGYNPEIARNVSADLRYLLWMLDAVEGLPARGLLAELGMAAPEEAP